MKYLIGDNEFQSVEYAFLAKYLVFNCLYTLHLMCSIFYVHIEDTPKHIKNNIVLKTKHSAKSRRFLTNFI